MGGFRGGCVLCCCSSSRPLQLRCSGRDPSQDCITCRALPRRQNPDFRSQRQRAPDDIPLARRSYPVTPQARRKPISSLFQLIFIGLVVTIGSAFLFYGPLRGLFPPEPVPGLRATLSADGRLLGHLPYPEAKSSQLVAVAPGMLLRPDAAMSFAAMQRAAAADGVTLNLLSAFRSIEVQRQLFFDVKADRNQSALDRAKVSAPPGFSEHSTGYAVDLGDLREPQTNLSANFVHTDAYRWLRANAARFQFNLSFPEDNPQGVSFEPWHWRYEGSTESLKLFEPAHRLSQGKTQAQAKPPIKAQ